MEIYLKNIYLWFLTFVLQIMKKPAKKVMYVDVVLFWFFFSFKWNFLCFSLHDYEDQRTTVISHWNGSEINHRLISSFLAFSFDLIKETTPYVAVTEIRKNWLYHFPFCTFFYQQQLLMISIASIFSGRCKWTKLFLVFPVIDEIHLINTFYGYEKN